MYPLTHVPTINSIIIKKCTLVVAGKFDQWRSTLALVLHGRWLASILEDAKN